MRNLDSWVQRAACSTPAVLESDKADNTPQSKCPRGLRSPDQFRTDELIGEIRKHRVLWSRSARRFHSPTVRDAAYRRVAIAMNRRFPELRPWCAEEVESHWRLLVQYEYACFVEHGPDGKSHSFTCRLSQMSFMRPELSSLINWYTFIPRIYYRQH